MIGTELPLDVQATAFQAQVWQALRQIPDGSTQTYSNTVRISYSLSPLWSGKRVKGKGERFKFTLYPFPFPP
jgi:hypothetical protein